MAAAGSRDIASRPRDLAAAILSPFDTWYQQHTWLLQAGAACLRAPGVRCVRVCAAPVCTSCVRPTERSLLMHAVLKRVPLSGATRAPLARRSRSDLTLVLLAGIRISSAHVERHLARITWPWWQEPPRGHGNRSHHVAMMTYW